MRYGVKPRFGALSEPPESAFCEEKKKWRRGCRELGWVRFGVIRCLLEFYQFLFVERKVASLVDARWRYVGE